MICPNCGKEIRDGLTFCPACGKEIGGKIDVQPVHIEQPKSDQIEIDVSTQVAGDSGTDIGRNVGSTYSSVPREKKLYEKTWFVVVMLIFLWPVGLFLMWKYTDWNKVVKIVITVICALSLITAFTNNKGDNTSSGDSAVEESVGEVDEPSETKETIYEADESINDFVVAFNKRYPEMALSSDDLSVYNHHGRDHEDQVWTTLGEDRVLISSLAGGVSVDYTTYQENDDVHEYSESNRRVFGVVMPILNSELNDEDVEQRWQDVLNDITNSPEWDDGTSFSPGPNNDEGGSGAFEYIKIEKR